MINKLTDHTVKQEAQSGESLSPVYSAIPEEKVPVSAEGSKEEQQQPFESPLIYLTCIETREVS
jgi:hypothetical protein